MSFLSTVFVFIGTPGSMTCLHGVVVFRAPAEVIEEGSILVPSPLALWFTMVTLFYIQVGYGPCGLPPELRPSWGTWKSMSVGTNVEKRYVL